MIDIKLPWDHYSDQPHVIKDKALKKKIYKYALKDNLITIFTTLLTSPLVLFSYLFLQKKSYIDTDEFFGLCVNLDKEPDLTPKLVNELGVDSLLVRVPLWEMDRLDEYREFIENFEDKRIVVAILQDREHIEDLDLFRSDLRRVFSEFKGVKYFQIANAINRKKWAFFTMSEYLNFYKEAQNLRDEEFKDIKLIGSSVIDFEFHYTIRTLFNFKKIRYDIFSSLLYVDRRGSPHNRQMGVFDLSRKISLLHSIIRVSPKSSDQIFITETNWPLLNTAPYAPTSQKECVDEESYALYMVQYFLIALASQKIERVYWHQLVAPGYGLIDNRDGIKKYRSFYAFKTMIKLLKGSHLFESNLKTKIKFLHFKRDDENIKVFWSDEALSIKEALNLYGEPFEGGRFCYIINKTT